MAEKCKVTVYWGNRDFRGHDCGKEIKTEGAEKCNVHLAAERRKEKNKANKDAAYDRVSQQHQDVKSLLTAISEASGPEFAEAIESLMYSGRNISWQPEKQYYTEESRKRSLKKILEVLKGE